MKKLLSISVIAALAVLPMAANAATGEIVAGNPTNITNVPQEQAAVQTEQNVTAADGPKYALALEGANDGNVATAGYVKGAYNAAIKAINKVSETASNALTADGTATLTHKTIDGDDNTIQDLGTGVFKDGTLATSTTIKTDNTADDAKLVTEKAVATVIDGLANTYATQGGVVATIKDATASVENVSLTVRGTPTGTVSSTLQDATFSGSVEIPTAAKVATLTTWGNDSSTDTADVTLTKTATNISGGVSGTISSSFSGTGITDGTATGDISNIDVEVAAYKAS